MMQLADSTDEFTAQLGRLASGQWLPSSTMTSMDWDKLYTSTLAISCYKKGPLLIYLENDQYSSHTDDDD